MPHRGWLCIWARGSNLGYLIINLFSFTVTKHPRLGVSVRGGRFISCIVLEDQECGTAFYLPLVGAFWVHHDTAHDAMGGTCMRKGARRLKGQAFQLLTTCSLGTNEGPWKVTLSLLEGRAPLTLITLVPRPKGPPPQHSHTGNQTSSTQSLRDTQLNHIQITENTQSILNDGK